MWFCALIWDFWCFSAVTDVSVDYLTNFYNMSWVHKWSCKSFHKCVHLSSANAALAQSLSHDKLLSCAWMCMLHLLVVVEVGEGRIVWHKVWSVAECTGENIMCHCSCHSCVKKASVKECRFIFSKLFIQNY